MKADGFTEVSVIVDGALDEVFEVDWDGTDRVSRVTYGGPDADEGRQYDAVLGELAAEAESKGFLAEVFEIEHSHAPLMDEDVEDVCAQYATDHHPAWTFGREHADA